MVNNKGVLVNDRNSEFMTRRRGGKRVKMHREKMKGNGKMSIGSKERHRMESRGEVKIRSYSCSVYRRGAEANWNPNAY